MHWPCIMIDNAEWRLRKTKIWRPRSEQSGSRQRCRHTVKKEDTISTLIMSQKIGTNWCKMLGRSNRNICRQECKIQTKPDLAFRHLYQRIILSARIKSRFFFCIWSKIYNMHKMGWRIGTDKTGDEHSFEEIKMLFFLYRNAYENAFRSGHQYTFWLYNDWCLDQYHGQTFNMIRASAWQNQ